MITFFVLVSDRLSEKWQSLNFVFVKEILDAQISQNYTFQVIINVPFLTLID